MGLGKARLSHAESLEWSSVDTWGSCQAKRPKATEHGIVELQTQVGPSYSCLNEHSKRGFHRGNSTPGMNNMVGEPPGPGRQLSVWWGKKLKEREGDTKGRGEEQASQRKMDGDDHW